MEKLPRWRAFKLGAVGGGGGHIWQEQEVLGGPSVKVKGEGALPLLKQ